MQFSPFRILVLFLFAILIDFATQGASVSIWADEDESKSQITTENVIPIITKEKTMETHVGERNQVRMEAKIKDVFVTRPDVAEAIASSVRDLIVSANSPGVGKVIIQLDNNETISLGVRVYVADPKQFADELRKKIGHIQRLDIEVVKGKILVDGRALYLRDMDEIERAIGGNPSVINLTSLSSRNAHILAREIQRELRESGIYGANVEVRENRVTLVGSLGSELLIRKTEGIASQYTVDFDSLLEVNEAEEADGKPAH